MPRPEHVTPAITELLAENRALLARLTALAKQTGLPAAVMTFEPNPRRQGIVDSWPEDVDDTFARADWGWKPDCDMDKFFDEYFLPEIRKRYGK